MAIIQLIDPTTFEPQQYSVGDESTIPSYPINSTFTLEGGRVETSIFDLNGNLIIYNPNASYGTVENGVGGNPDFSDGLLVYPEQACLDQGLEIGSYNVVYNFLNNELSSSNENRFRIKEISSNRQEVRLTTSFLSEDELKQEVNNFFPDALSSGNYPDFALNFGKGQLYIANNILFDGSNDQYSILVKLYKPLPSFIGGEGGINSPWIVTNQRDTIAYNVEFEPEIIPVKTTIDLKGPNFSLPLNNQVHSSVKLTSFNNLNTIAGIPSSSYNQLQSILVENGVEINIDYTKLDNFIHFSSAEERVKNFYSKVGLIEELDNQIAVSHSDAGSGISGSQAILESRITDIIKNFDGFEYFMYYNSSSESYPTGSFPVPYPKSPSVKVQPFTLVSTSSAAGQEWYSNAIVSCSSFDLENSDNLSYTIPDYLLEDPDNEPYKKFVEMIGQHFDTLFVYAQDISNRYNADNRLDFGISKDLVGEAIKSMGLNLYTGNFTATDLYSSFTGINSGSGLLPPLPSGQTNITTYITASDFATPIEDVNKQIYKRIYHSLPLLLRQKGSLAGIRTLVNCFGIPKEILTPREFDIKYLATTQSIPSVYESGSISFTTSSISLPPSKSGYIPSELLSPAIRVQQDSMLKSESYDRSLQYVEVGYSPQGYYDENSLSSFDPLGSDFPGFNEFYFGDYINYYSTKFINPASTTSDQNVEWNWGAFIRFIKFFDSSLFNMIKDFSPVRSSTATGVIIKPTIKERPRQRPPQVTYENKTYSGSVYNDYYDWATSSSILRAIGDYDSKLKTGSYERPGSTGGGWNNSNYVQFISGSAADKKGWSRGNLLTPVEGLVQNWSESVFTIMGYAQQGLQTGSKTVTGNSNHVVVHNTQDEFYNGTFKQTGQLSVDYLNKEQPVSYSAAFGSGVIKTDNNPGNIYKKPSNNSFTLSKANIFGFLQFLVASAPVLWNQQSQYIYIQYDDSNSSFPNKDVLLANGSTLTFTNGGNTFSFAVGIPTIVGANSTGNTYIAFYAYSITAGTESGWNALSSVDYMAPYNPVDLEVEPGPWAYNDFNPLINNSFDPAAGLVNYNGIRKSTIYQDADYSPSASSSYNPINTDLLVAGSASKAAVQDSNYSSDWWSNSRYKGNKISSPDFNRKIITVIPDAGQFYSTQSLGFSPNLEVNNPAPPLNPPRN